MKFPRNARILKGQLDAAPFAGVFFCLLIFVLLSSLVYTPGVRITLPASLTVAEGIPGPKVSVELDTNGIYYFENQIVSRNELQRRLAEAVHKSPEPLNLLIWADQAVPQGQILNLTQLGGTAGISNSNTFLVTKSRIFETPGKSPTP